MYILGISCFYHDASAALLKDGVIVAAAAEERFTRKKHDTSFPINAIKYCLKNQNITIDDVEYVGFYEKPFLKFERVLFQHLDSFPMSLKTFLSSTPSWLNEKLRVIRIIKKELKYKGDILFIEQHMAHAASSFLISPFKKAAIVTTDGVGEWTTTTYGVSEGSEIHLMKEIKFPHSLGLLYSAITAYLGFKVNDSEYKVMGLSAWGTMDKEKNEYYQKLKKVIHVKEDGSYRLDMSYFKYHYADRMPSKRLCELLDGPVRKPESEMTQRHKDIAAALQMILEEIMLKMLNHVYKVTQCENVVLAGGVALNSVFNGKILKNTPFKKIWIQPDAGDGGTSIGVASYIYHTILGHDRNYVLKDAFLGPGFSTEEIREFLDTNNIKYTEFKDEKELVGTIAKLIYENKIIGWFQGRMEWGPRALGARSILANPCNSEMRDILNLKVKHREKFRPFAPVVCEEDAMIYFDCDNPIPEPTDFMLMVYPIRKEWRDKLPAVTHVDGSGRLQTIRRFQNPLYYDVIKEFGRLSEIPILVNTSFNIRGEPIVCTPFDAYKCMMGTGFDFLVMDKFLIKRDDNPQDIWDSEKYAKE
ncbi:MAG: carbamoyltransferase [Candidatus Aenigmarchaeota archaeon]|nr:carbamoyltransferase [Candidatus Aenigmarchaeota archaeon]